MKFNLIATCSRYMEFNAARELENILYLIGDKEGTAWESPVAGLIFGRTNLDPYDAISKIRELLKEKPWEFHYIKRIIPVELVVRTDLEKIKEAALKLAERIPKTATYRISIEKRHTDLHSRDLIDAIAPNINVKVDLTNPEYTLLIEIVGRQTGISLLSRDKSILNVQKELVEGKEG